MWEVIDPTHLSPRAIPSEGKFGWAGPHGFESRTCRMHRRAGHSSISYVLIFWTIEPDDSESKQEIRRGTERPSTRLLVSSGPEHSIASDTSPYGFIGGGVRPRPKDICQRASRRTHAGTRSQGECHGIRWISQLMRYPDVMDNLTRPLGKARSHVNRTPLCTHQ